MTRSGCESFEFDLRRAASAEAVEISDALALHLDVCPACRRRFDRGAVPLDPVAFERVDPPSLGRLPGVARVAEPSRRPLLAAALVLAALGLATLWTLRGPRAVEPSLALALVEDHIRYLGEEDRQSALPPAALARELQAYVDFPVVLPPGGAARLTGARRCFLLGRRVVLAFYRDGAQPLSYFVLPEAGLSPPREACGAGELRCAAEDGFAVVTWRQSGLLHGVVAADRAAALKLAASASGLAASD